VAAQASSIKMKLRINSCDVFVALFGVFVFINGVSFARLASTRADGEATSDRGPRAGVSCLLLASFTPVGQHSPRTMAVARACLGVQSSAFRECLLQAFCWGLLALAGVDPVDAAYMVEEHPAADVSSFTDRYGFYSAILGAANRVWQGRHWVDLRRRTAENATTFLWPFGCDRRAGRCSCLLGPPAVVDVILSPSPLRQGTVT